MVLGTIQIPPTVSVIYDLQLIKSPKKTNCPPFGVQFSPQDQYVLCNLRSSTDKVAEENQLPPVRCADLLPVRKDALNDATSGFRQYARGPCRGGIVTREIPGKVPSIVLVEEGFIHNLA